MHRGNAILVRARRPLGADLLSHVRIDPLKIETRDQVLRWHPVDVALQTREAGIGAVLDDGDAVDAQEGKLEVVPVLPEDGAGPTQVTVEELRLPADLVVLQVIGGIRAYARLGGAVHAPGPETLRVGRVHHRVRRDFVREIDSMVY